jgi:hypothetical protein
MVEKCPTGDGELRRAPDAGEELDAELTLQLLDLPAERRLGDVESLRGAGEVTLFRDGDERASESELQHRRGPRALPNRGLGVR